MNKLLAADVAGFQRAHELANYTLAATVPIAAFSSKGSYVQKTTDWVLGLAIPLHMHISTNAVVTDYVPKNIRGPARVAVLGATLITYLGIMKVNLSGPGLTETVKGLWAKPQAAKLS